MKMLVSKYEPWWAQRRFHASRAPIRVVVAGRQSGKTHAAAEEIVRIVCRRPKSVSCLLMPTYKSTKGPLRHVRRALEQLGGHRWRWFQVEQMFRFWNGAEFYVRTADDKAGVPTRGLTIDGVLWSDEGAYVPREAWDAARLTQAAVKEPLAIITTTPCGKNWVYDEYQAGIPGKHKSPLNESFRFKSLDSPFCNEAFVEDMKVKLGNRRAMQELNAEFLGDADSAFKADDVAALFKPLPERARGKQLTLGVDLGKEQDYTVCTLMNEFGESRILGRWRRIPWTDQKTRIVELTLRHRALLCLDLGSGGGYGGMMQDLVEEELKASGCSILPVKTGNLGVRAQLMETLIADMEARRLAVEPGEHADVLRHELTFFEAHRSVVGGVERWRYHGPKGTTDDAEDSDHDDCVISLALANWGRVHGWNDTGPGYELEVSPWVGGGGGGEVGGSEGWWTGTRGGGW